MKTIKIDKNSKIKVGHVLLAIIAVIILTGDIVAYNMSIDYKENFEVVDKWTSQTQGTIYKHVEFCNYTTKHCTVRDVRELGDYHKGQKVTLEVDALDFASGGTILFVIVSLSLTLVTVLILCFAIFSWALENLE